MECMDWLLLKVPVCPRHHIVNNRIGTVYILPIQLLNIICMGRIDLIKVMLPLYPIAPMIRPFLPILRYPLPWEEVLMVVEGMEVMVVEM